MKQIKVFSNESDDAINDWIKKYNVDVINISITTAFASSYPRVAILYKDKDTNVNLI
jgi:hypothetical protein